MGGAAHNLQKNTIMSKYDDAIELLENYRKNAERIAQDALIVLDLLQLLRLSDAKPVKDVLLPAIKDRVANLVWNADQDLQAGDSTNGYEELEAALEGAIKSITGRKMKWHPHWL